jgi:hypothetical protein
MNKSDSQVAEVTPRPLEGRRIGISISESDDLPALGLGNEIVNTLPVDLARRLIALGASVALGHNWRTGGVMEAVARFALSYKIQSGATEQRNNCSSITILPFQMNPASQRQIGRS